MTDTLTFRERFEVDHHIVAEIGRGSFGNVHATISKHVGEKTISELRDSSDTLDVASAKIELRKQLRATKFLRPALMDPLTLRKEKEIMQTLSKYHHSGISQLLAADEEGCWLTTELLTGGNLQELENHLDRFSERRPWALAWYMLEQLADALLAFDLGYPNGVHGGCMRYSHNDIGADNLMLRAPGAYRDYPDLVLVDFGQAGKLGAIADDRLKRSFRDEQIVDLRNGAETISVIFYNLPSTEASQQFWTLSGRISKVCHSKSHDMYGSNLLHFLTGIRKEALEMRDKYYEPLGPATIAYFNERSGIVSDQELEAAFPALAD